MTVATRLIAVILMAMLGLLVVQQETLTQQVVTGLVLIIVSIIAIGISMRWITSER